MQRTGFGWAFDSGTPENCGFTIEDSGSDYEGEDFGYKAHRARRRGFRRETLCTSHFTARLPASAKASGIALVVNGT